MYTARFVIFNLDYEMDFIHFISNVEDPIPSWSWLRNGTD